MPEDYATREQFDMFMEKLRSEREFMNEYAQNDWLFLRAHLAQHFGHMPEKFDSWEGDIEERWNKFTFDYADEKLWMMGVVENTETVTVLMYDPWAMKWVTVTSKDDVFREIKKACGDRPCLSDRDIVNSLLGKQAASLN